VIDELMIMEYKWNDAARGNPNYSKKTCQSVILSTTHPHVDWPHIEPGPSR